MPVHRRHHKTMRHPLLRRLAFFFFAERPGANRSAVDLSYGNRQLQLPLFPPRETKVLPPQQAVVLTEHAALYFTQVAPVRAIELLGEIDDQHQLRAQVPEGFPAGSVRVIVLMPEEDEAGLAWAGGVSAEWSAELSDPKQDIYTLDDGQPVNAPR